MAAATILMAILGCGDAGTGCEAVAVSPVRYESVSACVAAQNDVLARTDIMYPVITAECRRDGETTAANLDRDTPSAKPARRAIKQASLSL